MLCYLISVFASSAKPPRVGSHKALQTRKRATCAIWRLNGSVPILNKSAGSLRWMYTLSRACVIWCAHVSVSVSPSLIVPKLFTGRHPFHDLYLRGQCSVMLAVGRGEIPTRPTDNECLTETTDAIWSLIQECWQREPGTRPSMLSIIQHLSIADTFAPTRAVCHLPKYPGERRCALRDCALFNSL
jgi:hypothetical protein